jgi:foldase protein PrsA
MPFKLKKHPEELQRGGSTIKRLRFWRRCFSGWSGIALSVMAFDPQGVAAQSDAVKPAGNSGKLLEQVWDAPGTSIVGSVKGVPVTKDELLRYMWVQGAPAALDDLLKKRAVKIAAEAANINVGSTEIQSKIGEDVARTKSGSFEELLKNRKMPVEHYLEILLMNMRLTAYTKKTAVQLEEADYNSWVKIRYIYCADARYESDPAKRAIVAAETRKRAEKIRREIKSGADFSDLANKYSDSPENRASGAKRGGYMGWVTHGWLQFTPALEEASFSLKTGEVSNPVRSDFGWYLVKVEAVGKEVQGRDNELAELITERKVRPLIDATRDKIWADANLENRLMPAEEIASHAK